MSRPDREFACAVALQYQFGGSGLQLPEANLEKIAQLVLSGFESTDSKPSASVLVWLDKLAPTVQQEQEEVLNLDEE